MIDSSLSTSSNLFGGYGKQVLAESRNPTEPLDPYNKHFLRLTSFLYSQENAVVEWKFSRARMWLEWIDKGNAVPVPFNILYYVLCILCCICSKTCCCKEVRHESLTWAFYWVMQAQVMNVMRFCNIHLKRCCVQCQIPPWCLGKVPNIELQYLSSQF